jgi:hypothetical protein
VAVVRFGPEDFVAMPFWLLDEFIRRMRAQMPLESSHRMNFDLATRPHASFDASADVPEHVLGLALATFESLRSEVDSGGTVALMQERERALTQRALHEAVLGFARRRVVEDEEHSIWLTYIGQGGAHDDLVLRLGKYLHPCDSYYYALDSGIRDRDESPAKVREVCATVLSRWLAAVQSATVGDGLGYLVFDFQDQATGWIEVSIDEGWARLSLAWSSIEGWAINPSDEYVRHRGFNISDVAESVVVDAFELVESIEANRHHFLTVDQV